jgi:hypothetical protein
MNQSCHSLYAFIAQDESYERLIYKPCLSIRRISETTDLILMTFGNGVNINGCLANSILVHVHQI